MSWGASEWAALGSWAGAIATSSAALISLRIAKNSNKPKIKVQVSTGFLAIGNFTASPDVFIKAINQGVVPVTLQSSFIRMPGKGKSNIIFHNQIGKVLPAKLDSAEEVFYAVEPHLIANILSEHGYSGIKKLKFVFVDNLSNSYICKFKFNIDSWKK